MSLAAFGGGFAEGFGNSYNQAVKERQAREQSDRDTAATGLLEHIRRHPELEPQDQAAVMGQYLKLKTGKKLKNSDIKNILAHHDAAVKSLNIPKDAGPTPAQAPPSTPEEAAASADAQAAALSSKVEAPPPSDHLETPDELNARTQPSPAPAPGSTPGPTLNSPPPQAPPQARAQAPISPESDLPTIGSGTSDAVAPVSELPTNQEFAVDPNRAINLKTRQANQDQLVKNAAAKNAHLQAVKSFEDWKDKYIATFGTNPPPHLAQQRDSDIRRAYGAQIGITPKLTTSSQAMTGQQLIDATGSDINPTDGTVIDPKGTYSAILDSGQNIVGARGRTETNQGKLVQSPDSPTGFAYLSPAGKLTLGAPTPRSQQERETVTETWRTQADGSLIQVQNRSVSGPKGGPAPATPGSNTTITPMTPQPTRGSSSGTTGKVIPAPGGRPMSQEQVMKNSGETQAVKSAIGLVADIHGHDLDTMSSLIASGAIEAAIDPNNGLINFVRRNIAGKTLTEDEQVLAGKLQHLNESINALRIPMGAGGFRGKDAREALIATKGNLGAAKAQTAEVMKQLMEFGVKQIAIRDKAIAKSTGGGKPPLDADTARAYMELNKGDVNKAISAAERAGYNVRSDAQ